MMKNYRKEINRSLMIKDFIRNHIKNSEENSLILEKIKIIANDALKDLIKRLYIDFIDNQFADEKHFTFS